MQNSYHVMQIKCEELFAVQKFLIFFRQKMFIAIDFVTTVRLNECSANDFVKPAVL